MKHLLAALFALGFCTAPALADTVFITGTDRGLGLEFARQYADKGWTVIATALRPDGNKDLADLVAAHKNVTVEKLDVTSDADIQTIAAKYKGVPIDVLLNNAGILGTPAAETLGALSRKEFHQVMDINVYGALAVSEALRENVAMSKQKKIVAITSGIGSISSAGRIGTGPYFYRISKTALDMAMQALAVDLKSQGVIVALISPTPSDTAMLATFRAAYSGNLQSSPPADSVAKVIPVIDTLDPAKVTQGILTSGGTILPW